MPPKRCFVFAKDNACITTDRFCEQCEPVANSPDLWDRGSRETRDRLFGKLKKCSGLKKLDPAASPDAAESKDSPTSEGKASPASGPRSSPIAWSCRRRDFYHDGEDENGSPYVSPTFDHRKHGIFAGGRGAAGRKVARGATEFDREAKLNAHRALRFLGLDEAGYKKLQSFGTRKPILACGTRQQGEYARLISIPFQGFFEMLASQSKGAPSAQELVKMVMGDRSFERLGFSDGSMPSRTEENSATSASIVKDQEARIVAALVKTWRSLRRLGDRRSALQFLSFFIASRVEGVRLYEGRLEDVRERFTDMKDMEVGDTVYVCYQDARGHERFVTMGQPARHTVVSEFFEQHTLPTLGDGNAEEMVEETEVAEVAIRMFRLSVWREEDESEGKGDGKERKAEPARLVAVQAKSCRHVESVVCTAWDIQSAALAGEMVFPGARPEMKEEKHMCFSQAQVLELIKFFGDSANASCAMATEKNVRKGTLLELATTTNTLYARYKEKAKSPVCADVFRYLVDSGLFQKAQLEDCGDSQDVKYVHLVSVWLHSIDLLLPFAWFYWTVSLLNECLFHWLLPSSTLRYGIKNKMAAMDAIRDLVENEEYEAIGGFGQAEPLKKRFDFIFDFLLKGGYASHLKRQDSCASHCMLYQLSHPRIVAFQQDCTHPNSLGNQPDEMEEVEEHDTHCCYCERLASSFKSFTCKYCPESIHQVCLVRRGERLAYPAAAYVCNVCQLRKDQQRHDMSCNACNEIFQVPMDLVMSVQFCIDVVEAAVGATEDTAQTAGAAVGAAAAGAADAQPGGAAAAAVAPGVAANAEVEDTPQEARARRLGVLQFQMKRALRIKQFVINLLGHRVRERWQSGYRSQVMGRLTYEDFYLLHDFWVCILRC